MTTNHQTINNRPKKFTKQDVIEGITCLLGNTSGLLGNTSGHKESTGLSDAIYNLIGEEPEAQELNIFVENLTKKVNLVYTKKRKNAKKIILSEDGYSDEEWY